MKVKIEKIVLYCIYAALIAAMAARTVADPEHAVWFLTVGGIGIMCVRIILFYNTDGRTKAHSRGQKHYPDIPDKIAALYDAMKSHGVVMPPNVISFVLENYPECYWIEGNKPAESGFYCVAIVSKEKISFMPAEFDGKWIDVAGVADEGKLAGIVAFSKIEG